MISESKQRDDAFDVNDDLLRDAENENYELKIQIEDFSQIIKNLKENNEESNVIFKLDRNYSRNLAFTL